MHEIQSDRPHLLVTTRMLPSVIAALETRFTLLKLWEAADPDALLAEHGATIRGMATGAAYGRVGDALLAKLPALEIIASFGVGYDNVDAVAAAKRGVVVTNTPGVLDEEVADLTIGLLLATLRQIPQASRYLREGRWSERPFPLSTTLRGRRVGILGLGNIGKAVARRLEGFDVEIAYHGRSRQDVVYAYHATPVALAEASDVLIVVVPGGAGTQHLVNADVLAALGPQGVLINVSRGSVVDEAALIDALERGVIQSAGLDVFAQEPQVPQALIDQEQCVLLPHIGSASVDTRAAMGQLLVDNLSSWFDGTGAKTPVRESEDVAR